MFMRARDDDPPPKSKTAPARDRGGADKHDEIEVRLTYRHAGAARHAEVALRYDRQARDRTPTAPDRLTVLNRARELRGFFAHRYGEVLPDDDAGREDLALLLGYVMQLNPGRGVPAMIAEARAWAPWLGYDEAQEFAWRIAAERPIKLKADSIAAWLGCTYAERTMLGFTTIGACDLTRVERKKATRKRRTETERERCRKVGVRPRAEYLANSLSRTRPWEAEGISRSTWERRRRNAVTQVPVTRKNLSARQALAAMMQERQQGSIVRRLSRDRS
jgi:hypothetical protein